MLAVLIVTFITFLLVIVGYKYLLFTTFDSDVARFHGVPTGWVDTGFSLVLAAVVVVSMQVLGVTMLASAIVIPPVIARLLTNSFGNMMVLSTSIGAFCGLGGIYASFYADVSSGPTVVLFSAFLFVCVLAYTTIKSKIKLWRFSSKF